MDNIGTKRIKVEKRVEVDLEYSEEEVAGSSRRRLGRLAWSQTRYKKKSNKFLEEVEEEVDT